VRAPAATGSARLARAGGDARLGGDDWDDALVQWLAREHLGPAGVDCSAPRTRANLKALAEFAKVRLSEEEEVVLRWGEGRRLGGLLLLLLLLR
jgi:molecular chaperone DnaK